MAMGYINRPVTMLELLSSKGFQYVTLELHSAPKAIAIYMSEILWLATLALAKDTKYHRPKANRTGLGQ
jgi:hypothetical protein